MELSVVTWKQLLLFVAAFCVLYYAVVLSLYFRKELGSFSFRRNPAPSLPEPPMAVVDPHPENQPEARTLPANPEQYYRALEILESFKPVFLAIEMEGLDKQETIARLRGLLQDHHDLKGGSFQVAIDHHLEQQLRDQFDMMLDAEDLKSIWQ